MNRSPEIFRNSLISLAVGFATATVWAEPPPAHTAALTASGATTTAAPAAEATNAGDAADRQPNPNLNIPIHNSEAPPRPRVLDLKPPDIRSVMSADELARVVSDPDEIQIVEPDTVQVHGAVPAPYVPSGFAALYWGATHPASAWRILAPVQ